VKYWTIVEPGDDDKPVYETLSEDDILKEYWPYSYGKMCEKYGKDEVDRNWSKQNCIEDWVVVHWAWETDSAGKPILEAK